MPEFKKLLCLVIFLSTFQKTTLSLSRGQDIFEDLKGIEAEAKTG